MPEGDDEGLFRLDLDGYHDCSDAFPGDSEEWLDNDNDGEGRDNDDDNDEISDSSDAFLIPQPPLIPMAMACPIIGTRGRPIHVQSSPFSDGDDDNDGF